MPKINVYLPDDLAAAVREARLSVSPICQMALAEAVRVVGAAREAVEVLRDPGFDPRQHPQISARVAAQMTPRLREALERARDLAGPDGLVEAGHLLAGVIDVPGNLGVNVLQSLDVDVAGLRDAAAPAGGAPGPAGAPRRPAAEERPAASHGEDQPCDWEPLAGLSPTARLAIAAALEAATDLGHTYLGCEHLVLALAGQADGAAGELLRGAGIKADSIRRAIPAAVSGAALGYRNAVQMFGPATGRLEEITRRLDELDQRLKAGGL
jgi:Clp amino terminal domain, pathogenicity island component